MMEQRGVIRLGKPPNETVNPADIYAILTKHCSLWKGTGLNLKLDFNVLKIIEKENDRDQRKCFEETLNKWISQDREKAKWGVLELALTNANRAELGLDPLLSMPPKDHTSTSVPPLILQQRDQTDTPDAAPPLQLKDHANTPDGAPNTNQLVGVNHASKDPKYPPEKQDTSDGDGLQVYKMDSALVIIINIKEVKDKAPRIGAKKDGETLQNLFEYLGFTVRLHDKGLTAEEMKKTLNDVAKELNSAKVKYDCLLVAILTHGEKMELLHGADGTTVSVTDLIKLFDGSNCESLLDKPKIFFIQACRGTEYDRGKDIPDGEPRDEYQKNETDETDSGGITLPTMSDYLVAFATNPSSPAFRNSEKGSYFILALNDVFKKMAKKEQLIDMLTEVNRTVAEPKYDRGQYKQQPHFVSALRKKLYLQPGGQQASRQCTLQ